MNTTQPVSFDNGRPHAEEVASHWAALVEAARTDADALAFLDTFGPWAASHLAKLRKS